MVGGVGQSGFGTSFERDDTSMISFMSNNTRPNMDHTLDHSDNEKSSMTPQIKNYGKSKK
jgi:hypothetical protein